MNIVIKCDNLEVRVERPFALSDHPAFEYKVKEYYAQIDLNQLVNGGLDLVTQIMKKIEEAHTPTDPETAAKRDADYKDFLAGLQRKHGGNGNFEDQDVPQ